MAELMSETAFPGCRRCDELSLSFKEYGEASSMSIRQVEYVAHSVVHSAVCDFNMISGAESLGMQDISLVVWHITP